MTFASQTSANADDAVRHTHTHTPAGGGWAGDGSVGWGGGVGLAAPEQRRNTRMASFQQPAFTAAQTDGERGKK